MTDNIVTGRFDRLMANQDDQSLWGPVVSASIVDPNWVPASSSVASLVATDLVAVIDTGAQNSAIDTQLAERLHLKKSRQGTLLLHGDPQPAQGYSFIVYFNQNKKAYSLEGPSKSFRATGASFDLILGWDFLQHYTLQISKKAGTVVLQHEQ